MKKILATTILSVFSVAIIFLATTYNAEAVEHYPVSCTLSKEKASDVLVVFDNAAKGYGLISTEQTSTWSDVLYQNVNIPKGKYSVTLQSFDGYSGRSSANQSNEQFWVLLAANNKTVAVTNPSKDIPDGKEQAYWTGGVGNIDVGKAVDMISLRHVKPYPNSNPNSHIPVCMLLKDITPPPVTPPVTPPTSPTPVNGQCNSQYNGQILTEIPATGSLCTVGTESVISGTGEQASPWTWNCSGADGGSTPTCTATKEIQQINDPSIKIIKDDNDNNDDTQTVEEGETATFSITVTNNGNTDLSNVKVTDVLSPSCDKTIGDLTVGEESTYTCTIENVTDSFTNIAVVNGEDNDATSVTDDDDSDVVVGDEPEKSVSVDINKEAKEGGDSQSIDEGSDAHFKITVNNNGESRLNTVSVSDNQVSACSVSKSKVSDLIKDKYGSNHIYLDPNESFSYTCTDKNVTNSYINTATATGESDNGSDIDSDTSNVSVKGKKEVKKEEKKEVEEEDKKKKKKKEKCEASIGDFVWNDKDGDGVQDSGEEGISNVKLKLYNGDDVEKTWTNSNGDYKFDDLCEGGYKIVVAAETLPDGCYQTYDRDGKLDHSTKKDLDDDQHYKKADFGYRCPTNIPVVSTSPTTGPGIAITGMATIIASGAAWFNQKRLGGFKFKRREKKKTIIDL